MIFSRVGGDLPSLTSRNPARCPALDLPQRSSRNGLDGRKFESLE